MHRHFARLAFALDHEQLIAGIRRARQAQHHHGNGRTGGVHRLARLVEQGAHAAEFLADQERIAELQRAAQYQHGGDGAASLLQTRFDHIARGQTRGRRLEFEYFGLQQDAVEQLIDAHAGFRRDRHEDVLAAPLFGNDAVFGELLPDLLRIGFGLVHLVERHDDGHFGRLRVLDGFDGLRHDAVVRAHHQDHDVGDLGAACTHGAERRVTRGIEKGHHALRSLDVVCADVLGDAAGLARRHLGAPDVIEQRGLAVIDVTHDGHHRRTGQHLESRVGLALQIVLDDIFLAQHGGMAHLLDHQHRGVLFDHLIDGRHDAHVHHDLDDFGGLDRHFLRQFAHRHRLGDRDFANHAGGRHLEAMLGVGIPAHRAAAAVPRFLLFVP